MNSPFQPKRIDVPGSLSDDAFQEQLKLYTRQQNDMQRAAPAPNSAVDMVDKIANDYLKLPKMALRAGAPVPGPLGPIMSGAASLAQGVGPAPATVAPDAQQGAIDLRSDMLSDAAEGIPDPIRNFLLGPAVGLLGEGGALARLGRLTPEQSQADADERLRAAQEQEQATKAGIELRHQLRQEPDASAGMGLPVPPGTPNKMQEALNLLEDDADAARLKEAETTRKEAEEAVSKPALQAQQAWWLNAARAGFRQLADTFVETAKLPAVGYELTLGALMDGGNVERSDARAYLDTVSATIEKMLPPDKARAKDMVTELAAGTGSMASFMLAGWLASGAKIGSKSATTLLGMASGGVQQYEDAEAFDAGLVQKYLALLGGAAIGATEAAPIDRMLFNVDKLSGGMVRRILANSSAGGLEEFVQELGQSFGTDVIAKAIYDENRALSPQRYLRAGLVGGLTGGMAGAATQLLHESGQLAKLPSQAEEEVQPLQVDEGALEKIIDDFGALVEEITGAAVEEDLAADRAPGAAETAADEFVSDRVTGPGGSIPVNERGLFEAYHSSSRALDVIDPAMRGTGPLRGIERERLGPRPKEGEQGDPNVVDRSYYGVGDPDFGERVIAANKKLPDRKRVAMQETDPYHGEGLGPYRHKVEVDPARVYNMDEDPLNLKAKLPADAPSAERITRLEKLISDAGFAGYYRQSSKLGQTAALFEPQVPVEVYNTKLRGIEPKTVQVDERELQPLRGLTTGKPVRSVVQAARAYATTNGIPVRRQAEYVKADPERGRRIAQAYQEMEHAPNDPKVKAAYKAMAEETIAQYQFVKATGLKIEAIEPGMPDPYPEGPKQVLADLERGHLWFFPTESGFGSSDADVSDNPLLAKTKEKIGKRTLLVNDVFRIVHDFFGHGIEGSGFGARGEENAWQSHMRLYSEAALPAVTSETRGQNSWVNFGPYGEQNRANQRATVYADQKTGIMPEWTWREGVEDDFSMDEPDDLFAKRESPSRVAKLTEQVPGFKGVVRYLQPDEAQKLTKAGAKTIVEIVQSLPKATEMAAVAFSGRAKRGWYARSANALLDIFGMEDAPRFAALLAALSPQTSVESNAVNALNAWANWIRAGRPSGEAQIRTILGQSVQGSKGEKSVLPAWINNSLVALQAADPAAIVLSGPKVNSFMENLRGKVNEVTNDAWMANYANVDQKLFKKSGEASPGKSPGYSAMSAVVRQAAQVATKMTGETWTPSEIQETVWSWAKTLYEKAGVAGETRSAEEIIKVGGMTAEEISATPDFASLFVTGVYRQLLEKGGYDVDKIAGRSGQPDAGAQGGGRPESAEGSAFAQGDFDRHLRNAARRLDTLRKKRQQEEVEKARRKVVRPIEFYDELQPEQQAGGPTLEDMDELLAQQGTSASRGVYKAERARPDKGIPDNPARPIEDTSLAKISRGFASLLDLTARQGRLTVKNAASATGQYSRRTDVVRLRTPNDLSTLVHEGGHALQFNAGPALTKFIAVHEAALMAAGTDLYEGDLGAKPRSTHIAEGFAEFFRVYTLNRPHAERAYPTLTRDFDEVLRKEAPELFAGLAAVGKQFEAWLQLPSGQLLKNMIVSGKRPTKFQQTVRDLQEAGIGTWMHEYARDAVGASINRFAGLEDLVAQMLNTGQKNQGRAIDLTVADDPRKLVKLAQNSGNRAMLQTIDGAMGYHSIESSSRSPRDAFLISQGLRPNQNLSRVDEARRQDFAAYLVALRGADEYRRMAEGKIERPPLNATLGDLQVAIQELNAKYPEFAEAAGIVHEYGMALWKKSYDAGLMSRDTYEDGLDRQFYAPLQRDMSDRAKTLGMSPLTASGGRSIVKRFRGSDRDIIDPMDVLMHKTFALEQIIARNDVMKALATLSDRAGKAGAFVERIPATQLIGRQYSVEEVAKQLTKDDTLSKVDAQDLMHILESSIEKDNVISFFRSEQASTKGENILFYWENGRVAALQLADGDLGADVVNTLNGVGRENMPLFTELLSVTSNIFRAGVTKWPDYLMVNFIRDQFSAFILNRGYVPFVTGIKGVAEELRQRQWAKQYNAAMGTIGGMTVSSVHQARVDRDISALKKKGYLAQAFAEGGFTGAAKGVGRIAEMTETGSRIGIFRTAFERAKADGLTDWQAALEGSYLAMDYMNFGLNGSRTVLAKRLIPFLNAQLQGLYKMTRTLGGDEVRQRKGLRFVLGAYFKNVNNLDLSRTEKEALRTGRAAWVKMASLGLISAALHFLFEDDPDYEEAGEYLRTTGWVIPMGDGRLFYVPKPFELALMANFTERALESAAGDPTAKARFMRGVAMALTPPTGPPAIVAGVEALANYDFFTGRNIEPVYQQGLEKELQFDSYTSELAKQMAPVLSAFVPGELSPLMTEHLLSALGSNAYRDLATLSNVFDSDRADLDVTDMPLLRRFVRDTRRGSASSRDFWAIASTVNGSLRKAEASYKRYLESGNEQKASNYLDGLDEEDRAYALLSSHFDADAKRLHPFYRARQMTTIISAMRREMVSDNGLGDTTSKTELASIRLTSRKKTELDEALSELARREMRNTLVAMKAPGWADKRMVDTAKTVELLGRIDEDALAEFERRVAKAKVYDFETIVDYWPEVKDRLLTDRENTFLDDVVTAAKVIR